MPSLLNIVINTIFSWACSFSFTHMQHDKTANTSGHSGSILFYEHQTLRELALFMPFYNIYI